MEEECFAHPSTAKFGLNEQVFQVQAWPREECRVARKEYSDAGRDIVEKRQPALSGRCSRGGEQSPPKFLFGGIDLVQELFEFRERANERENKGDVVGRRRTYGQ